MDITNDIKILLGDIVEKAQVKSKDFFDG